MATIRYRENKVQVEKRGAPVNGIHVGPHLAWMAFLRHWVGPCVPSEVSSQHLKFGRDLMRLFPQRKFAREWTGSISKKSRSSERTPKDDDRVTVKLRRFSVRE